MKKLALSCLIGFALFGCYSKPPSLTNVSVGQIQDNNVYIAEVEKDINNIIPTTVLLVNEDKYIKSKTNTPHYNKNNILEISNISYDRLYNMLKSTSLSELTDIFIEAEETYGVNALAVVSIVALESSWGDSPRARNDNNLTGYAIYNRGSSYSFSSKEESIMRTTQLLKEDYLTKDGKYYNGKSLSAVNIKYCASDDWHIKVNTIANQLLRK